MRGMPPASRQTSGPLSIQGERQAHIQETLWADPGEGAAFLEALPPQYKFCREKRHRFDIPVSVVTEPIGIPHTQLHRAHIITQIMECACGATQSTQLNSRGVPLDRPKIHYPHDYLAQGMGRIPRESFGVLRIARVVDTMRVLATAQREPRKRPGRAAS